MGKEGLPAKKTPEEIAKIQQERMISDVEALKGGAEMTPEGIVEFSPEQTQSARRAMDSDLNEKSMEGQVAAAEARGQEKGTKLERQMEEVEEVVTDVGVVFAVSVSNLNQLKSGILGNFDSGDYENKRLLEEIVASGNGANRALYDLERRSPYAGPGTKLHVPRFDELDKVLKSGGKISSQTVSRLREELLTNAGMLEMMAYTLRSIREGRLKQS